MAVVGYVTLEEANEYIKTHYPSTDEVRLTWEILTEDDQAVYLQKSFDAIETLPFRGRKTCPDQTTAFPRWPSTEVPGAVKKAQIEQAFNLSDSTANEETAIYDKLWKFGVDSYSIGNLSESSSDGAWGRSGSSSSAVSAGITSTEAINYLKPYLRGGFRIE